MQTRTFSPTKLEGVLLPITTPFTHREEALDLDGLAANLEKWNRTGIVGYAVLGSTGERVHLNESECLAVIERARNVVPSGPDGLAFIVGAGQESTRGTIRDVHNAARAGADAVLVITPHFYRTAISQAKLIDHYLAVADASPITVVLYSMPALTGVKIAPETIARLSEHQNIVGVKDSSADVDGLKQTVALCPAEFAVLTGNGTVFRDALAAGARGAILAVGCVAPEMCVEIMRAVRTGDEERGRSLQAALTPLARAVTTDYGIGGLKAALDMIGYTGGSVRAPLRGPEEAGRQEIAQLLTEAVVSLQNFVNA